MKTGIHYILITSILLLSTLMGCSGPASTLTPGKVLDVKRGDIDITVRSEGSMTTPDKFDLAFRTAGIVQDRLVEPGDQVRAGGLLMTLDTWAQINEVEKALYGTQTAQNKLSLGCSTDHLPYNYPDMSVSRMADETQRDIDRAADYFNQGNYKDAGYWLVMAYFDVLICEELIKTMPDPAQLAGAKSNSIYNPDIAAGSYLPLSPDKQAAIDYLGKYKRIIKEILVHMKDAGVPYQQIGIEIASAQQQMTVASQVAKSTIAIKSRMIYEYPDTQSSADFLQASMRLIGGLQDSLRPGSYRINQTVWETVWDLNASLVNLQLAREVLETQTLVFETGSGINWKTLQQYNLDLQASELTFYQKKRDLMKTVIIAPSDGKVDSVSLNELSLLTEKNFATITAVVIVNTEKVKFKGKVDEIDRMKVKTGQPVTLEVDALADTKLKGEVEFISPVGTKENNIVKFDITIKLITDAAPPPQLLSGWSATAEILIKSAKNAVMIPPALIIKTPAGPIVLVVTADPAKPERRPVKVGIQNLQYAEIVDGLNEGEKVQVPGKSDLESIPTNMSRPGAGGNPMRVLH